MIKCPNCGSQVILDEVVDTYASNEMYEDICVGECIKCHTNYTWHEYFSLEGRSKLEPVKE